MQGYPKDKTIRDIDNIQKAPIDVLKKSGIMADDRQIDLLIIDRVKVDKDNPRIAMRILSLGL